MPIEPGTKLGPYRVVAPIGAGGMGEVYRARDDRLNRDVALKLLPDSVEHDPARLARFQREAQLLASLTHGNIAQVYGLEEQDGRHAIVLELVEGEDLSERVARGPIPLDEAREIALQIAAAVEAAHERGIVHRDLKPANVKLAPDGTVKVLDFGLAKALAVESPDSDPGTSPTLTAAATQAGIILGTAAYMAPEQAKGKPVDRRADIWAFGCVLYEMLTGRAPFRGDGVSEVLAHVITQEPDLGALPGGLPDEVTDLLARCLRKEPKMRLPDIAAARIALTESKDAPAVAERVETTAPPSRSWIPRIALTLLGLAVGLALGWALLGQRQRQAPVATHFDLVLDPAQRPEEIALSPDGRLLVYGARIEGTSHLFARRLDGHASEQIAGTEGGQVPFFSPDGRQIGFFSAGQLKRVHLDGGVPDVIVAAPGGVTSAFWAPDDTIVYGTSATGVLMRVEARAGAEPAPVRVNGLERGVGLHTARPLPGWRRALVTMEDDTELGRQVVVLDLETGDWKPVTRGGDGFFVPPDRLMYVQQGRLMVTGFDPNRGETVGDARRADLAEPALFMSDGIDRFYAAIANGLLVYPSGTISNLSRILRVSSDGKVESTGLTGVAPQVDSTGRRVVACPRDSSVHVLDLVDRTDTPLTFLGTSWYPMWSHDDARIVFADRRRVAFESWSVAPDGTGEPELLFDDQAPNLLTTSVVAGGTYMGYVVNPDTKRDIWIRRPGEGFEMILQTPANERVPILSPDGRLFAYVSDEEGSDRIFIRDLESLGRRWPVTTEGGISPVWSRDGKRLYFIRGESIHVVDVRSAGGVRIGQESVVLTQPGLDLDAWGNQTFDAMPDGGLLISVEEPSDVTLRVVLGWEP